MDNRQKELSDYRLHQAEESLEVAKNCCDKGFYKDSINRSYYSAFYSVKAVLAYGTIDFKFKNNRAICKRIIRNAKTRKFTKNICKFTKTRLC